MSDQDEPAGLAGPEGSEGPGERGERDGGGGGAGRGGRRDAAHPDGGGGDRSLFSAPVRMAISVLGPMLLTTAYFTLPFEVIGPDHPLLAWVVIVGLLSLLALGMVVTTNRALAADPGRFRHPGVGILLLSWASILVFAAAYWAMATRHNQFVGLQTRLDSLYFTGVTIATVGYGDIHPSGQLGRAVVLVQLVYTGAFLVSGVAAIRTRNQDMRAQRMRGGA